MESRWANLKASHAELHSRLEQDWTHDVGCIDQNQERGRPHTHFPTKLQGGNLRQLCDEHRWCQHIGLLVYVIPYSHHSMALYIKKLQYLDHELTIWPQAVFQPTRSKRPRSTLFPTPTLSRISFLISPNFTSNTSPSSPSSSTLHLHLMGRSTCNQRRSARSSMVSTNAFSAPAARHPALHTGGIPRSISAQQSFSRVTDGWPIPVTRRRRSERLLWITVWACTDATLSWTARGHAPRVSILDWQLRRSRRRWPFKNPVTIGVARLDGNKWHESNGTLVQRRGLVWHD